MGIPRESEQLEFFEKKNESYRATTSRNWNEGHALLISYKTWTIRDTYPSTQKNLVWSLVIDWPSAVG